MEPCDEIGSRLCQSPITGYYHFYRSRLYTIFSSICCVNPLHQVTIISTGTETRDIEGRVDVSIPYNGLIPFLPDKTSEKEAGEKLCQSPISGYYHFYESNLDSGM